MAKKPAKKPVKKAPAKRRKRAKKSDGTFQADDPNTPQNEAYAAPTERESQRMKVQTGSSQRRLGGKLVA